MPSSVVPVGSLPESNRYGTVVFDSLMLGERAFCCSYIYIYICTRAAQQHCESRNWGWFHTPSNPPSLLPVSRSKYWSWLAHCCCKYHIVLVEGASRIWHNRDFHWFVTSYRYYFRQRLDCIWHGRGFCTYSILRTYIFYGECQDSHHHFLHTPNNMRTSSWRTSLSLERIFSSFARINHV